MLFSFSDFCISPTIAGCILDDTKPDERKLGIEAGYAFWPLAEKMVVYIDYGVSGGMSKAIDMWKSDIEFRKIGENL